MIKTVYFKCFFLVNGHSYSLFVFCINSLKGTSVELNQLAYSVYFVTW